MADGVILDESSARELRRDFRRMQQDTENLRRTLAHLIARDEKPNAAPRPPQKVQVYQDSGSPTVGDILQANGDGLHPGRLRFLKGATWSTGLTVWVKFIDWEADAGAVYAEHGRYFIGALSGAMTSGGVTRPLYLCEAGYPTFLAQHASGVSKGSTPGTFKLYHRSSETDSGFTQSATPLGAAIGANKWCTVQRLFGGKWYAGCWET